jgi:ABC-type branched-subunit amino acid transport system substrate-binding protein
VKIGRRTLNSRKSRWQVFFLSALLSTAASLTSNVNGAIADDPKNEKAGVSDKEVIIGSCAAIDGPVQFLGKQLIGGAKLYLDYINEKGGVNGRKIRLISHNDNYDPDEAIKCFNRLASENIFAAAFFVGTPTAAKYVPMADSRGIPLIGLYTGAQLIYEPVRHHVFNVRASYFDEAKGQVDHLWEIGKRKIAVIYQNDAFGAAVLGGVKTALEQRGSSPVALASFPRNSLEVEGAIKTVRAAAPDAVVMVGTYKPLAEIMKRSHVDGWSPLYTTVSFVGTEAIIESAGKDADGLLVSQVVPSYNRDDLATVSLYKTLLKKSSPSEKPTFAGLEGFVDALVVVEGLKKAGPDLTRSKFIAALEGLKNYDIGLGSDMRLSFSPGNHKGLSSVNYTVVRKGQAVHLTDWKQLKN